MYHFCSDEIGQALAEWPYSSPYDPGDISCRSDAAPVVQSSNVHRVSPWLMHFLCKSFQSADYVPTQVKADHLTSCIQQCLPVSHGLGSLEHTKGHG